ncbi:winged helix-turn-helix transcriptional regulator [Halobacteriales archaeon Cl-PHB]
MRGLDDTDRRILELLLEDGRRPYREIAEDVDLSPPAVSDRVDRLRELGLIRRFTVDLDRSLLQEGVPVLVTVDAKAGAAPAVADALDGDDAVEYCFRTADDRVVFTATVPERDVGSFVGDRFDLADVRDYEVRLLADAEWTPGVRSAQFAPTCAECGNTVTTEGESERLDGEVYHFCCGSCRENFVSQFERLQEGA